MCILYFKIYFNQQDASFFKIITLKKKLLMLDFIFIYFNIAVQPQQNIYLSKFNLHLKKYPKFIYGFCFILYY